MILRVVVTLGVVPLIYIIRIRNRNAVVIGIRIRIIGVVATAMRVLMTVTIANAAAKSTKVRATTNMPCRRSWRRYMHGSWRSNS